MLPGGANWNVGPQNGHICTPMGIFPQNSESIRGEFGGNNE